VRLPASVRTDELHSDCGARLIDDARNVAIRAGAGLSTGNVHEAADEQGIGTLQTQKLVIPYKSVRVHNTRGAPTSASPRVPTWRDVTTDIRPDHTRVLVTVPHGDERPGIFEGVATVFLHGVGRVSQAWQTGAGGRTPRHRRVVAEVPEPGQAAHSRVGA
jgi:hypothetical protein